MSAARFYVDADLAPGDLIALPPKAAHHATHVLRLREGDAVVLFNGRGGEYHGSLRARGVNVELTAYNAAERESSTAITLVQSWIATDKLEWLVEKAVELGASRIILAPARRSVVQLEGERLTKRLDRLRDIVVAACCQCGRNRVPAVEAFEDLRQALDVAKGADGVGVLLDPDATAPLAAAAGTRTMAVAVGPEGGFEKGEAEIAQRMGYEAVRLGPRVLRTETAGLVALAALQAIAGDLR